MSYQTHGHYAGGKASPTYNSWQTMKTRCTNPSDPTYPRYGGRGITVYRRWLDSFEAFLTDMGERPEGTTLDRKDNDKGYSKENCRWVTRRVQANNRTVTKRVQFGGEAHSVPEWARLLRHSVHILKGRFRRGWPVELALSLPSCGANYRRTRIK